MKDYFYSVYAKACTHKHWNLQIKQNLGDVISKYFQGIKWEDSIVTGIFFNKNQLK
jgi:hypothetical protein